MNTTPRLQGFHRKQATDIQYDEHEYHMLFLEVIAAISESPVSTDHFEFVVLFLTISGAGKAAMAV